jgi:hypothetical protein
MFSVWCEFISGSVDDESGTGPYLQCFEIDNCLRRFLRIEHLVSLFHSAWNCLKDIEVAWYRNHAVQSEFGTI